MKIGPLLKHACRLGFACLVLACAAGGASARDDGSAAGEAGAMFAEMRAVFAGISSRAPGMPGNVELAKRVRRRFEASGFKTGAVRFRAPVFVPGEASITLGGGKPVSLRPMHPTLMRPGNFAEPKFATRLVYLGRGRHDDLERVKGTDLNGAVALMEFDCGDRWLPLLRFGLKGFVFIGLGDGRYDYVDSYGKIYNTEVPVPRFFVPAADGARLRSACKQRPAPPAVVVQTAPSRWKLTTLSDLWVLIPGKDDELKKEVVVFTAPLDANSVVPERSVGAQSAGNLFLLLKLLDDFKAEAPLRSVMLVAVNAHTHNFLGERIFAWHLVAGADKVEEVRYTVARSMRQMRLYTEMYQRLQLEPTDLDEEKLHIWMEVLWQLDARQEVHRKAELKKKDAEEKRQAAAGAALVGGVQWTSMANSSWPLHPICFRVVGSWCANQAWANVDVQELDALAGLEFEPTLDLTPFTEKDYQAAIDAVVKKLEDERGGFFSSLTTDDEAVKTLEQDIERVKGLKALSFAEMKKWAGRVKIVFDDEKLLESWRIKLDGSTGVRLPIKGKLQDEAKRTLNELKMRMLGVSRSKGRKREERDRLLEDFREQKLERTEENDRLIEKLRKEMEEHGRLLKALLEKKADMTKVLVLFNKIDIGIGRSRVYYRQIAANDKQRKMLKGYRDSIAANFSLQRAAMEEALRLDSANDSVRDALGKDRVALVFTLDVNWHAGRFGLCSANPSSPVTWLVEFGKAAAAIAERVRGGEEEGKSPFVDAMSRVGSRDEAYFFHSTVSPAPCFHAAGATAVSVRSAFANHGAAFSPGDTFDRLDAGRILRQQKLLRRYFQALLADDGITSAKVLAKPTTQGSTWSTVLRTYTLDQFSGKVVPDLAIPDCLIALYTTALKDAVVPFLVDGDVVNCFRVMGDKTGSAILYGVWDKGTLGPVAYQLDDDFTTALYDMDKGRVQESKQINSNVYPHASRTLPMFPCTEFQVYDRIDPTLISDVPITVQQFWPMSADMRSAPQKYGTHGAKCLSTAESHASSGPISASIWRKTEEFEPERLLLLTNSKRCALNATAEEPEGAGFETPDEFGSDFLGWVARDMDRMNRKRRAEMKGISNELVTDFLASGGRALEEMEQKAAAHDHNAFALANYKALGGEVKAYRQIRKMNTDMLKAIVLYMALMLPFCFFVQKLLFGFTKLELDMLAFVLLFTATYMVFRFIHPAFRIAMNPEAIFIAFILGAVGCFVTWILHSRFETEMQLLFRNITGMEGNVAYATVGQTAMMIGVNNMKRRRIRTSLTTATIVLVVFTMLAFSSVSKKMQPTLINKADESPYTGIFYHWPAGKLMDEATVTAFTNMFGNRGEMLVRRVLYPPVPMLLENAAQPKKSLDIEAVVGLPIEENGFLGRLPLIHGEYFSSAGAREIILPGRAFEALKIPADKVGAVTLRILGEELKLVGVIDDDRYRFMRDLNPDLPLLPRKQSKGPIEKAADEPEDIGALIVDMSAVAFLPADLAAKFGAKPFTISVRFLNDEPLDLAEKKPEEAANTTLWNEVALLLGITQAKFHVGSEKPFRPGPESQHVIRAGIYYIGSSYRTSIGGLSRLFIPLLIAGSIILNTMLGTVYERKYEIAVYNAIGLNPTHIFLFFLAEAFVYGVIGSVAGYLVGQVLAMLLKTLHVVEGVNINFSSLMVGYAILFTIGLVLLSTIYPGFVATRTAVPSGKRKWSLPDHDGQRMNVLFPFIYEPDLAPGVMYYLYEYFLTFTEQSIGDQIVSLEDIEAGTDDSGRAAYRLKYAVALAPFDLGVTQSASFATRFDEIVDSYRVHMTIVRVSGQDTNWVTTNRPFLEKLRKLLIRWRNIDPTQHNWYVEQGKKLFEGSLAAEETAT